ncbi:WD domain, G-beta repeat family protein [Candida parapsilosis]|uniref:Pre-mRNA-processing factor 17 n=1 Tax=Candida parapsilosis TaxID=5480 RepID=A0A8X7NNR6_CANPA|nr:WD domain, G-beta repeat family protein [Candida parapsilosis]KAF6055625.1 WD domain, G-beta repeat family protein [Candida parapsilosis]KAF6058555.1 WD domain, G-beta repeat family protein [Candida parapsilosis]KAF6067312.1 WD domain, G-beta repeat family protein [Candida parapsilosis]
MSLVQGYSSSEEEIESQEENAINHKRQKTSTNTFQKISYDPAAFDANSQQSKLKEAKAKAKELKLRRKRNGGDPWAPIHSEEEQVHKPEPAQILKEEEEEEEENTESEKFPPSSEFVGSNKRDYQGRSFMHIPSELTKKIPGDQECFVPKSVIHTFTKAHPKGVNKLQFFPHSGHLLLSCGNDATIKLWAIRDALELLRIYKGHKLAVKDISFNSTGDKFLSCGFDKIIRLWNTETGEVIKTFEMSSIPNVVRFNPNIESEFVVGLSNHKIEHYDLAAIHNPIQTYDHHIGAINDILVDKETFISTSDDKSVRVWHWQINIPIKVISDPSQFSTPSIKKHPKANYIALQSMDNCVKVIHSTGKYKWNKNKLFKGHQSAGYGIEIGFSPDGKILMSGDARGYAVFWDWQSKKIVNKLKLSTLPIKCITFHPLETSKVAIAGNSGDIYYCD